MFSLEQLPEDLKYDVLEYSSDSNFVLVKKGKKSTLYDARTGEVDMSETKSVYLNFPGTNCYVYFDESGLDYWIYWRDRKDFVGVDNSGETCKLYFPEPTLNSSEVQYNNSVFNLDSRDFDDNRFATDGEFDWSHLEVLSISENRFIINCFESDYYYTDSVGNGLYYEGFNHSGIYDLKKRMWLIEPMYKEIYKLNDHILCLKEERKKTVYDFDKAPEIEYVGTYYVYDTDLNLVDSFPADLSESTIEKFRAILDYDELTMCSDNLHFITRSGEKFGFVKLKIVGEFEFKEYLPAHANYLHYSEFHHAVVAYCKDSLNPLALYITNAVYGNNGVSFQRILTSDDEVGLMTQDRDYGTSYLDASSYWFYNQINEGDWFLDSAPRQYRHFSHFGLIQVNDSLLIVNNYNPDRFDYDARPLGSISYPGEDSVFIDPNTGEPSVIYPFYEGFYYTGVFNLNSSRWLMDPGYQHIFFTGKNFVLQRESDLFEKENRYEVADIFGSIILDATPYDEILFDPERIKFILPQSNVDSVFAAPTGRYDHTLKKVNSDLFHAYYTSPDIYYVRCGNELGVYWPSENFKNEYTNETFEYLHPSLGFFFYLQGDSIYFRSHDINVSVSKNHGKIIFERPDQLSEAPVSFALWKIEGNDTIFLGEPPVRYESVTIASIEMKGDVLIVNDHNTFVDQSCIECWHEDNNLISYNLYYESESSSVWKKTGESWQRISPYYATVAAIPKNQFIVSTGFYEYESHDYYIAPNQAPKIEIEGRYMLLDSTMKAVPYMDYFDFAYIEDLGFGLKVQLNKGDKFFFMTYDLVAVTNAEWDRFELENGKLKAIIDTKYEVDPDTGELIYNEYGAPNELVSATTKYFKLP